MNSIRLPHPPVQAVTEKGHCFVTTLKAVPGEEKAPFSGKEMVASKPAESKQELG